MSIAVSGKFRLSAYLVSETQTLVITFSGWFLKDVNEKTQYLVATLHLALSGFELHNIYRGYSVVA